MVEGAQAAGRQVCKLWVARQSKDPLSNAAPTIATAQSQPLT
jgi:hypothetical protein